MVHKKPARKHARKEPQAVPAVSKSPKKSEGHSIFTWLIVLALLGAWMSVAVVWFDLVEYNSVVGTLGKVYDADGDGDFDVEDAKVLLDLEKAYDRVPREELWYCMRKSGVAEKYVRVVQDMYERSRTVVRCAVGQTEEFNVEVGLHQGSALRPFLFAIVMDQLSEEVRQESPWTMMFADDIVICSESREQVEENLERWRFVLERRGMKVSRSKTEYMCVNEREGSGTVRLQGEEVKKVQEFKYLGSTVQSNGECGKEVKKRVQAGLPDFCKGLVSVHTESADALADGSSELLQSFLAFLCDVLMPYEGGGVGESFMKEEKEEERVTEPSTRQIGHKLKSALKEQLRMIHEKIEAKKIAKLALAEVRNILAQEEEERKAILASKKAKEEAVAKLLQEKARKEHEERLAREKAAQERAEQERLTKEKAEKEKLIKEKAEKERLAKEQAEKERLKKEQAEKDRLAREKERAEKLAKEKAEKERQERERLAKEQAEKERAEKERLAKEKAEKERAEKERLTKEKAEKERAEKERLAKEQAEKERAEKERLAKEKAEKERADKERIAKEQAERERAEKERLAKEKAEKERAEKERLAKERAEKERLAKEKAEKERIAKEKAEKERLAKEKAEKERAEKERLAKEKAEKERAEKERLAKEKAEKERAEKERLAKEKAEKERAEKERLAKERAEKERAEKERLAKERAEKERAEKERLAKEKAEKERAEKERLAKEKAEKERAEKERLAKEKAEKERAEKERLAKEKAEKERAEKERLAKEKAEKERAEKERLAKEKAEKERAEKERLAKEKAEKERAEKERLAKEKAEKERAEKERLEKEKAEKERLAKEKAEKERAEKERLAKEKAEKERAEKERLAKEKTAKQKSGAEILEKAAKVKEKPAEKGISGKGKEKAKKERIKEQIVSENKDEPPKTADASVDHNAEEKPLESYKETGSEEEKNEKPVPDVSLNEGMMYSLFSLLQISSTSTLHDSQESIDSTGGSTPDDTPETKAPEMLKAEPTVLPEVASDLTPETVTEASKPQTTPESPPADQSKPAITPEPVVKKKKPSLLNKFDKTIKSEINAAEKLRKKGKVEEALRAFEALVQKYPQSPRSRYGKAQAEDDMAEKLRSNEMLLKAVNTYREAAELPDAPAELIKTSLKRRADRQQFLGRTKGSLVTLERLVQIFPDDITLKNELGVAYLLIGDNKGAKQVYEEVLAVAPSDGFAKVHYGFILKSENKIAESIPYLKEGLESGAPGTDDGRFYFHLGDALQRVGEPTRALEWYEAGYRHGHFASVWQRSLYNVAGLRAQPWWTAKETGYVELVRVLIYLYI
ncbi:hypothetical protein QTP86_020007 [Hemibagrus guttatus]|nr:hypothetical protein QTP86_020007 [Hemibagrus guttatus]